MASSVHEIRGRARVRDCAMNSCSCRCKSAFKEAATLSKGESYRESVSTQIRSNAHQRRTNKATEPMTCGASSRPLGRKGCPDAAATDQILSYSENVHSKNQASKLLNSETPQALTFQSKPKEHRLLFSLNLSGERTPRNQSTSNGSSNSVCHTLLVFVILHLLIASHSNGAISSAQSYQPLSSGDATMQHQNQQAPAAISQADQSSNPQAAASSTSSTSAACFGGLQTFEKISMSSFENPAGSSGGSSSGANGNSFGSGILVQQDDQALTSECINLCRSQSNCLSFVIDYNKFECKSYATTQQELQQEFASKFQAARAATGGNLTTGHHHSADNIEQGGPSAMGGGYQASASSNTINFQQLLPSASSNYFEKICLDGVANRNQFSDVCGQGRLWTIERVVDSFLDGFVEKEVTNVNNKDECSKLCIFETQFVCRSADYDQSSRLCRLSKEDRRTQPQAMRYVANSQRQYLENQCATPGPSSCVYETKRNVGIISMDALKFAQTAQDCQMKCNQETTFNCRSYSFHQQRCFLSGDDSVSLNSNLIKLPQKQGWAFGEKKCLVELCTKGIFSYEKITGYALRSALSTPIDLMMPGSSSTSTTSRSAQSFGDLLPDAATNQARARQLPPHIYGGSQTYNGTSSSSLASAMMMMMMSATNGVPVQGESFARAPSGAHSYQNEDPMHESASTSSRRTRSTSNLAITEHCRHSCDLGYLNCPAFTIDYKNNRCQRLDRNSQGRHHELVARDGFAYYEKICLRVPEIMSMCQDKYWIFERVLGYELAPRLYDKSLKFVQSRRDCEEYCLEEKQFQCRSALYNDETSDCKLSRLNRRLALQEGGYYRNFNARISYLENNCVRDHELEHKQCYYEQAKEEPSYPTFTERIEMASPVGGPEVESSTGVTSMRLTQQPGHPQSNFSSAPAAQRYGSSFCEQLCNDNSKFECHSFGYYASTAQCFLSGDDSISAGEMATTPSTGFRYYEKKCRLGPATGGNSSPTNGSVDDTSRPSISTLDQNPYFQPPMRQPSSTSGPPTNEFLPSGGGHDSDMPSVSPPFSMPGTNITSPQDGMMGGGDYSTPEPNLRPDRPVPPSPHGPALNMNETSTVADPDLYKCGTGHTFVYQRISGFEPIGGYLTLLARNNEQPGIVAECSELCRRAYECRAFVVDYQSNQCYAMLENSSVGLLSLRQILGKDYFEGFCVANHLLLTSVTASSCRNKTWVMDKIVDQAVVGVQHSKLIPGSDRVQCRQACLEERLFLCKSAMYDSSSAECKLYSIDRESIPQMRLIFTKGVDFFENQCQISSNSCPYDAIERDMTIITITKSIQARSTFDCELACNSEVGFNCRSYTYLDQYPSLPNMCLLSSDSRSTSQRGSVKEHPKTLYAERNCYYRRPRFPGGGGGINSLTSSHKYDQAYSPPLIGGGGETSSGALRPPANPLSIDPYSSPLPPKAGPIQTMTEQEGNALSPHDYVGPALGQGACEPHQFTFERTFGYDFKLAPKERAPIAPTIGIAIGCQQECLRRGDKCQSFVVDYALPYQSCFLIETQAGANKRLLVKSPNSAYFEKVCLPRTGLVVDLPLATASSSNTEALQLNHAPLTMLNQHLQQGASPVASGATNPMVEPLDPAQSLDISPSYSQEPWSLQAPHAPQPPAHANQLPYYLQQQHLAQNYPSRSCAKLWTFERFVNHNFTAPVDKLVENSLTRAHCETQCLNEASFSCRAATYDYTNKVCRLFKNTRRTIMSQFVDLDSPMPSGSQQLSGSSSTASTLANSHPGTAHVLDPADAIQTSASSMTGGSNGLQDNARRSAQASARQLITAASTVNQQQHHVGTLTAEPLNPSRNIDYLENTCTPEPSSCQYRQVYDQFSPFIDKVNHATSLNDCQRQCDQERLFSCKSVNYDPTSRNCMLVNEDLISLSRGGAQSQTSPSAANSSPLLPKRNTIYSEKGNCEMISVQCNSQEMLVAINFDSPFRGRVMAKGNPEQCYVLGDGQTNLQFSIVFGPKCNSRQEGHNTFVNEVVIQQHPVIMTESDKTVRVMCAFEAPEQTITLKNPSSRDNKTTGIDVGAPDISRTRHDKQQVNSVVSNKAAPPSVMLRILDQNGRDATMINLGDDLMLKIQMQMQMDGKNSALGIFARNLAARSSNGESLLLIDNEGCPVDPQVFPALEIDQRDGKSLLSTFKAFRFPSSGLVNFEVQIRFCPEKCQPVDCHKGSGSHRSRSYGRRRKRQVEEQEEQRGRSPVLQSVSSQPLTVQSQQQQQSRPSPMAALDSLSTVMKPGKAFEYVRKLMLPQQQTEDQTTSSLSPVSSESSSQQQDQMELPVAGSTTDNAGGDQTGNEDSNHTQGTSTVVEPQQQNEDFDSHSLRGPAPSEANPQVDQNNQFSPPDYSQEGTSGAATTDQFVPSMSMKPPSATDQKSILMHVDDRVVPSVQSGPVSNDGKGAATDVNPLSTRENLNQLSAAPYGHFQDLPNRSVDMKSPGDDPSQDKRPTADGEHSEVKEVSNHDDMPDRQTTPIKVNSQADEPQVPSQHERKFVSESVMNHNAGFMHQVVKQQEANKEMPLKFSILVGENHVPSDGQPGVGQDSSPVVIKNSTNMDLDHIVIPGKKGQFEDSEMGFNSISTSDRQATLAPTLASSFGDNNFLDGASSSRRVVGGGRGRDTSKRNASYEQVFDALPSNSISSEIEISHQRHNSMENHHQGGERSFNKQHSTASLESAASHDCQVEAGRSRLRAIIWTGGIVISLNVCLIILSLYLYIRKVHLRHNHSIVGSASDYGTTNSRSGRLRIGRGASGTGGEIDCGTNRWPSVILKSKNKLSTSLNAHEQFFCRLNSKPTVSGDTVRNEFNWPSSSSQSTVSSLASPMPPANSRISQMRPSLKSVPFDAHSTIRNGNFNTGPQESDTEKDEYTARYTNNIDVLHSGQF